MAEFKLPDIGEGIKEVIITDILIKKNQVVKINDLIMIVESEKASMEIPSDFNGKIKEIHVKKGQTINPGNLILTLSTNDNQPPTTEEDKNIIENKETKITKENLNENKNENTKSNIQSKDIEETIHASPAVRKLARELDCNLNNIQGTGRKGRITTEDVYNHTKKNISENSIKPKLKTNNQDTFFNDLSKWGVVEKIELNSVKKITAKRLHKAWNEIPHVTQFDEIDITELDKTIKTLKNVNKNPKIKISFIPFFMKAILKILQELPIFNTSLSDDKNFLIQKKYYNIGVATETSRGLVVPVIKNIDKKSIKSITQEFTQIIYKAKEKRLTIDDMTGGCFTISSLGNLGGSFFTPIINPPEVAILGISKIEIKPKLINNKFKARKILPVSLSYDHRVIDGADAARFTSLFAKLISQPDSLLN